MVHGRLPRLGFRNRKVPSSVNIVAIGDSHTFGNCAKMDELTFFRMEIEKVNGAWCLDRRACLKAVRESLFEALRDQWLFDSWLDGFR